MTRKFLHFTFRIPQDDLHTQGALWFKRLRFLEKLAEQGDGLIDEDVWLLGTLGFQFITGAAKYASGHEYACEDYTYLRDWVQQLGFEIVSECADAPAKETP
jgi:hypothetical protein